MSTETNHQSPQVPYQCTYNQHHDHFDIELQGASEILQAQDQLLRDASPEKVWLVCDAQLKVFTYCIVIIFLTPTILQTLIASCFFLGNDK